MPTPTLDQFEKYLKSVPLSTPGDLSEIPVENFREAAATSLRHVDYLVDLGRKVPVYQAGFDRHVHGVAMLCFFQMIAAFERYLKELAAVCVDEVAPLATDNRLGEFSIGGDDAAPHVQDQTIGRALCETALWHDIDKVNERFKKILRYPNDPNKDPFQLFPSKASSPPEARLFPSKAEARSKVDTLRYLFQLRHSIAHNLGHVTRSDGNKVERLLKAKIQPKPGVLSLERKHVYYLQRFLEPVVDEINDVVATRLTLVLTEFEKQMPALMDLNAIADRLARLFQTSVTVGGITRTP